MPINHSTISFNSLNFRLSATIRVEELPEKMQHYTIASCQTPQGKSSTGSCATDRPARPPVPPLSLFSLLSVSLSFSLCAPLSLCPLLSLSRCAETRGTG